MLLILIPIVWLAVLLFLVAICRVAADGDAGPVGPGPDRDELIGIKLTLSHAAPRSAGHRRLHGRRTLSRPSVAAGRRRSAAH